MSKSTMLAKVLSNGRVTIPKVLRDTLQLRPGSKVDFEIEGKRVVLRVRSNKTVKQEKTRR